MLTILIASDHQPYRETLTRLLALQPAFSIIGVCADMHAAMAITAKEQPNIVLIDGSSDQLAAIAATRKIICSSTAGVVALSRYADATFADHMIAAGALGYVTKQSPAAEIINAIAEVAKDNLYLCAALGNNNSLLPLQTPVRGSFIKKSIAAVRDNATAVHWHSILSWTN